MATATKSDKRPKSLEFVPAPQWFRCGMHKRPAGATSYVVGECPECAQNYNAMMERNRLAHPSNHL